MLVITTCAEKHLSEYANRWLEARQLWPKDAEFRFYTENFSVDCDSKDLSEIKGFPEWKARHAHYVAPSWQYDVVKFANKAFAQIDAFRDYDGIGVWCDADCIAYKKIPYKLIQKQLGDAFVALYQRSGMYSETGFWIVNCADPVTKDFFDYYRWIYESDSYKNMRQWHDCYALDAAVRKFAPRIVVKNLSDDPNSMHPQASGEFAKYLDHQKGNRKFAGYSPENAFRKVA